MCINNGPQNADIIKKYCVLHCVALLLAPKNTSYLNFK